MIHLRGASFVYQAPDGEVEALRRVELDVPQPTELCFELRQEGVPLPDDVLTAEECAAALAQLLKRS